MTLADLDQLIENSVITGQIAAGVPRALVAARTGNKRLALLSNQGRHQKGRGLSWTETEDDFLRANVGRLSDEEMARHLGRSVYAVHIRRERGLRLPAPSKGPTVMSLEQIAAGLGMDGHSVVKIVERGGLVARELPFDHRGSLGRRMRVVDRINIVRFCVNPLHWMMFDIERIGQLDGRNRPRVKHVDPTWWASLRRLVERRRAAWTDAWWTVGQVADYLEMSVSGVNKAIRQGRLPAVRWGNWWVLRSDATRPGLRLMAWTGKGGAGQDHNWVSPRADAFIVLATAAGLPDESIGAMMGWQGRQVEYRLRMLRRRGRLAWIIRAHKLPVLLNRHGDLLADWKKLKGRFRHLARAMRRLRRQETLDYRERLLVRSVLATWSRFFARTKEHQAIVTSCHNIGHRQVQHFHDLYLRMRAAGIDPYRRMGAR